MHSLAMHADNRTSSKGLVSPKVSGNTSPNALIRSQHLPNPTHHHHPMHPHLVMPHAALHHQHPNPYSPYSLGTSLSLTPTTTESATSSPTSSSHAQHNNNNNNPAKYDLTSNHHQQLAAQAARHSVTSPAASGNGVQSNHHSSSHHQQNQHHQNNPQHNHHEYSHFGSAAAAAAAASMANVKSETPTSSAPNYDYMSSQCYFGGSSVPVSSAASGFAGSSAGVIPSPHATGGDLAGYHHQHNVIQAAKLMASS